MTLQQLEYILAVNQFRHFAKAAEYCRVTQPTLSAMIQKLEEELDTRIFDHDANANVIMCSAMGQQAMVIEAIQSGAKDFIVKPFQAERVLEAVKKVVG